MKIVYSSLFLKSAKRLPVKTQKKLDSLTILLAENIYNPLLHTKQLSANLAGFYSFRITRDFRVIFQFLDEQTIQLVKAADRKDIYR